MEKVVHVIDWVPKTAICKPSSLVTSLQEAMAPHLTPAEQDAIFSAKAMGKTTGQIWELVKKRRARAGTPMVNITVLRRFMRGRTHKRGKVETRGRARALSRRNVLTMDAARRKCVKETQGAHQVTWADIIRKGRAPRIHPTTAARAFAREGLDVKLRRSREKPQRTPEVEAEREDICGRMRKWPLAKFIRGIDMIIDNKRFDVPTTPEARLHQSKAKVVAQLRTRSEGLQSAFTKPGIKRHRKNLGGTVNVCAGISNCRIVLWEYLQKWSGDAAAELYKGAMMDALVKARGAKRSYLICEDNDPTGYKSSKGRMQKKMSGIRTVAWPRYSPDLMPLDFTLWEDIEKRVIATAPSGAEPVDAFKVRLRRVAMRTPPSRIRAAVAAMRTRATSIWKAKGKNIPRD